MDETVMDETVRLLRGQRRESYTPVDMNRENVKQQAVNTKKTWQTISIIFWIVLIAFVTSIAMCWFLSLYHEYHIIQSKTVLNIHRAIVILSIIIMALMVVISCCTGATINGFKKHFWSTLLSLMLSSGAVSYMLITAIATAGCINFFEGDECYHYWIVFACAQYLLVSCFLVIQFLFLNFTNICSSFDQMKPNSKYFCTYFTMCLLIITNYTTWLGLVIFEVREYLFHTKDLPISFCNTTIPYNISHEEKVCLYYRESTYMHEARDKAAIILFCFVLENCLLSTSKLYYKFISTTSESQLVNSTKEPFEEVLNTHEDPASEYQNQSVSLPFYSLDNIMGRTHEHGCFTINGDTLNWTVGESHRQSYRSTCDVNEPLIGAETNNDTVTVFSHSNSIYRKQFHQNKYRGCEGTLRLFQKFPRTPFAIFITLLANISYLSFVILFRVEAVYVSCLMFHVISTIIHAIFSFLPNVCGTIILCCHRSHKLTETDERGDNEHIVDDRKPNVNKTLICIMASMTCFKYMLNIFAGYHAKYICDNHNSVYPTPVCDENEISLLIYRNAYSCLPLVLQLFVALNINAYSRNFKYGGLFRSCLTIIAINNITFWAISSFGFKFEVEQMIQNQVFGLDNWFIIRQILHPCCTFFSLYSFEIFIEHGCFDGPRSILMFCKRRCFHTRKQIE